MEVDNKKLIELIDKLKEEDELIENQKQESGYI